MLLLHSSLNIVFMTGFVYLQESLMVVGHLGLMVHAPSLVVEKVSGWTQGHATIPHLRMGAKTAMD